MNEYLKKFWNKYSFIHNSTKELYILSEEYSDELDSFIQPIKEQKDSLEHLVRAYTRYSSIEKLDEESKKYIISNLDKALGHTFRSFFDCADVLSIILREKLSKELSRFSYGEIIKVWPEYEQERITLVGIPKKIADMRISKDVAKTDDEILSMVKDYKETIDGLFQIYNTYMKKIYPVLNKM